MEPGMQIMQVRLRSLVSSANSHDSWSGAPQAAAGQAGSQDRLRTCSLWGGPAPVPLPRRHPRLIVGRMGCLLPASPACVVLRASALQVACMPQTGGGVRWSLACRLCRYACGAW